jgi:hypothetical protein
VKPHKSFTAKDAKDTKEIKSLTTKDAKDTKESFSKSPDADIPPALSVSKHGGERIPSEKYPSRPLYRAWKARLIYDLRGKALAASA